MQAKLPAETRGPAEDSANDVAPAFVGGRGAVGYGKGKRANMVCDDAKRVIGFIIQLGRE